MSSIALADQLDEAINMLMLSSNGELPITDPKISGLLGIAARLRFLPSPDFKAHLKAELAEHAVQGRRVHRASALAVVPKPNIVTMFSGVTGAGCPVHRNNLMLSFMAHAAVVTFLLSTSLWMVQHQVHKNQMAISLMSEPSPYTLPADSGLSGGGGGGGDRDKSAASQGHSPRFSAEQLTPPAIVVRNESPKLSAEATVVGPPKMTFSQTGPTGDPLSAVLELPSNGNGAGGGIGSGIGGGAGNGTGAGVGPGWGGGIGGGVYKVGGGVSAPRAIYDPDPEYSEEARKAKHQGKVILWVVVGPDGRPRDVRVARPLGMGLDEKAVAAVRKWRFEPAVKDGKPVAVQVNIEVSFRLY
jgi:TonB family protein